MIKQESGHIIGISSVQGRIAIPFRQVFDYKSMFILSNKLLLNY